MQAREAEGLEMTGHGDGIFIVYFLLGIVALGESDAFAVDEVDGWDEFNAVHRARKFFRICSPIFPLFSGWNWVV